MNSKHSAHCRACKDRVRELLTAIYGECRANFQFPWPARPEDYANTAVGDLLQQMRSALGDWRRHRDFIKSAQMPACDYFIPDPPFIVEFDESQHFSRARLVMLSLYPADLDFGFSVAHWQELCRQINAQDDEPFDRDERRAWYDTLRDLVPIVHGFKPTVRLYAEQFDWCGLDAGSVSGLETFQNLLRNRLPDRSL